MKRCWRQVRNCVVTISNRYRIQFFLNEIFFSRHFLSDRCLTRFFQRAEFCCTRVGECEKWPAENGERNCQSVENSVDMGIKDKSPLECPFGSKTEQIRHIVGIVCPFPESNRFLRNDTKCGSREKCFYSHVYWYTWVTMKKGKKLAGSGSK